MRKIIAVMFVLALCSSARALQYPELGACMNDNVRLREDPGTDGKVIGRANAGTQFVILGEVYVDGQKWYEIDHPAKKGTAFIRADFVNGWYDAGETRVGEDFANVRLTFGVSPEKTRALLGKPEKAGRDETFEVLEYPGVKLWYDEGSLARVEVSSKGYAIGGIQVGDSMSRLSRLGMPDEYLGFIDLKKLQEQVEEDEAIGGPEGWLYESESGEQIFYQFGWDKNEKSIVDWMSWYRQLGEG